MLHSVRAYVRQEQQEYTCIEVTQLMIQKLKQELTCMEGGGAAGIRHANWPSTHACE